MTRSSANISSNSRPCTSAGAVGGASGSTPSDAVAGAVSGSVAAAAGDASAPSAAVATTTDATSNPGEPVQADASLLPSPAAAAAAATGSSENRIERGCNEGKRAREAQQEAEAGETDAIEHVRGKRLKAADETVKREPEGKAKAEDATMEDTVVKVQQDGSQANGPSLKSAAFCGNAATRVSAGGAGPAVERAGSIECGDAGKDVESAALDHLYSTISQLDATTRDCIRSALLRLATSAQAPASASLAPSHSHAASTLLIHSHSATSLTASFCSSVTPSSIPQSSSTPQAYTTSSLHLPPLAPPPPPPPPPALSHPHHTSPAPSSQAAFPAVPHSFPLTLQPSPNHPPFRQTPHAPHHSAMFPYTACFLPCCSAPDAGSYPHLQNPSHPSSLHPYPPPPQHAHLVPLPSAGPRNWVTWHGQSQPASEMWVVPGQHSRAAGAVAAASAAGAANAAGEARQSQTLQQGVTSGLGNNIAGGVNRNHPCLACY
ncbi:unnamed protein product [Closterium sp. Yama58-4]|nr:unnamed protein product [Closterium sp. Yama58-4]